MKRKKFKKKFTGKTRDGRKAVFVGMAPERLSPLIAAVRSVRGDWVIKSFTPEGNFVGIREDHPSDLVLRECKCQCWLKYATEFTQVHNEKD